jgi:peptide deformylase
MIRSILHYPDKRLRDHGKPVVQVTPAIRQLVDDMAETMYAAPGVGLAATQIGEAVRIFVIDIAGKDEPSELLVFINPEIIASDGDTSWEEGCLSFPGATEDIDRKEHVTVRAMDLDGKSFELACDGLLAIAVQHELDHLNGKLMIDLLGPLKKRLLHRKMVKRAEAQALR